ncbi:MAG TPA: trigger factor [Bacteroidota bacterium]|nr:trigger factor [Bacteroidota bacterium]
MVEVTIHEVSEVSREVEVLANADELRPHFEKAYRDYRPKVEIKGFRKGKAPLDLVKKLYGEVIEHESLDTIASELYRQIVRERELKPIGEPVIVDMDYKRGEQFRFKVRYDIRPKIQLKDYKGIQVEKPIYTVTDQDVENELLRLRRMNSNTQEAQSVTDLEHVVTLDLQDVDKSGMPIIGKKSENVRFYLADPQLEEPFRNALKSAEVGGEYRVEFEHEHGDHKHEVNAVLKVKKIDKVVLPELTDEFVQKITKEKIKTVEELKARIREDLVEYWNERSRRQVVNAVVADIIRRHDFQVPDSLVRSVLEGLIEDIKNQSKDKRLPENFDVEKFIQENRAYAVYQSKWALLREEIISAEGMTVDEEELEALAEAESEKIGIEKERLKNYYRNSEQIKDRLLGEKLIAFLIKHAKIKEVPATPTAD